MKPLPLDSYVHRWFCRQQELASKDKIGRQGSQPGDSGHTIEEKLSRAFKFRKTAMT